MAARLCPANVRQTHQSLHHLVADSLPIAWRLYLPQVNNNSPNIRGRVLCLRKTPSVSEVTSAARAALVSDSFASACMPASVKRRTIRPR